MHTTLAAPDPSTSLLGVVTVSGAAFIAAVGLILGLKGSDFGPVKIGNKQKAAWWGIVTGTIWVAAGGTWAQIATGLGSVPERALASDTGLGNPGQGGIAIILGLLAFGPKWGSKTAPPAIIGIMAGVVFGTAGGLWTILVSLIKVAVGLFVEMVS